MVAPVVALYSPIMPPGPLVTNMWFWPSRAASTGIPNCGPLMNAALMVARSWRCIRRRSC